MTTDKRDCSPDLRRFDTELRYFPVALPFFYGYIGSGLHGPIIFVVVPDRLQSLDRLAAGSPNWSSWIRVSWRSVRHRGYFPVLFAGPVVFSRSIENGCYVNGPCSSTEN